jgi:hypothetical protein
LTNRHLKKCLIFGLDFSGMNLIGVDLGLETKTQIDICLWEYYDEYGIPLPVSR